VKTERPGLIAGAFCLVRGPDFYRLDKFRDGLGSLVG